MLLNQMPGNGVGAGIQPLPGQLVAQPDDQRDSSGRLAVRPPRSRLERRVTLRPVSGDQTTHSTRRHLVAAGNLANSPAFDNNSGNNQARL